MKHRHKWENEGGYIKCPICNKVSFPGKPTLKTKGAFGKIPRPQEVKEIIPVVVPRPAEVKTFGVRILNRVLGGLIVLWGLSGILIMWLKTGVFEVKIFATFLMVVFLVWVVTRRHKCE